MKRDMNLIRRILLEIEKSLPTCAKVDLSGIEGYTPEQVTYHAVLLHEADLIEAAVQRTSCGTICIPMDLTWKGHEFLALARDEPRWKKACSMILKRGEDVALLVLEKVLIHLAMEELGL